jgi:hypothetical protein
MRKLPTVLLEPDTYGIATFSVLLLDHIRMAVGGHLMCPVAAGANWLVISCPACGGTVFRTFRAQRSSV